MNERKQGGKKGEETTMKGKDKLNKDNVFGL